MDKYFWLDPLETRAFAKNVPLRFLAAVKPRPVAASRRSKITIGNIPKKVETLWSNVIAEGFNALCFSQRRPVGPISAAVGDLEEVMATMKKHFKGLPSAFICHSRGGLISRKYMERKCPEIKALITIASPHGGSSLSKIGKYIVPLTKPVKAIVPKNSVSTVSKIVHNLRDLVEGKALKELMPDSYFIQNLRDEPVQGRHYLSFGGMKPGLLRIYRWEKTLDIMKANPVMTIPDSLLKFIPAAAVPDEFRPGKGDFMVTAESAVLPWSSEHYNLQANHFTIAWNKKVIEKTMEVLRKI
jgi:pimeloyl-ACP methyl ester carboxylesterase